MSGPSPDDYLAHVAADTAAYAAVLDRVASQPGLLGRPVAACPGWTLLELTHHLGFVHRWVCGAIRRGHGDTPPGGEPAEATELAEWFRAGAADLIDALEGDPATPAWTFHPPATLGFWQRRQAHENAVHRWDAERADGDPGPIDAALAADGVTELGDVFIPRRLRNGRLSPLPAAVALRATDTGDRWVLGDGDPVAELAGPAEVLLLHLWKRLPGDHPALSWTGDRETGAAVLALPLSA